MKYKDTGGLVRKNTNGVETVLINVDSNQSKYSVLGHETKHTLEKYGLNEDFNKLLFEYAKKKGDLDTVRKRIEEIYKSRENVDIDGEVAADLTGKYLFEDEKFLDTLLKSKSDSKVRQVIEKIKELIDDLIIRFKGTEQGKQLRDVQKKFTELYNSTDADNVENTAQKNTTYKGDVKYSLKIKHLDGSVEELLDARNITNEQAIHYLKQAKKGELKWNTYVPIRKDTPQVIIDTLENAGIVIENRSLVMQVDKAQQSMRLKDKKGKRGHSLSAEEIVEIVNNLDNPNIMILETNRHNKDGKPLPDSVAVFVDYNENVQEGLAVIEFESFIDHEFIGEDFGESNYHTVITVFEPDTERDGIPYDYVDELLSNPYNYELEIERKHPIKSAFGKKHPSTTDELLSDDILPQNSEKSSEKKQYSLSDSEGRSLTSEQVEFFKDSKVRDENGSIKVMYHGTSKGGYTVFDTYGSNYGLFGTGSYFTDNKSVAESYTNKGKGDKKQVYETYLNITNPIDMDAQADFNAWANALPDADFSNCITNEDCYRAMEEYLEDEQYLRYEASEIAIDVIQSMGYDGITHIGGGRINADGIRHQVYIAFEPEQIKNIDNIAPTKNPDIRYSLSDNLENVEKILYDNNNPLSIVNRATSNNNSSINWVYKSEIFL